MTISKAHLTTSRHSGEEILGGEVPGLKSLVHIVEPGDTSAVPARRQTAQAFIFTAGYGTVSAGNQELAVDQISLLIPEPGTDLRITSRDNMLLCLELAVSLSAEEIEEFSGLAGKLPYFIHYADCKTYREKIKSEKTINRTLLHEGVIPRLSIGSVETAGPDAVASHRHPMLEQLFVGLSGNDCTVSADGVAVDFRENDILHIPLGSNHGVRVAERSKLHYIWIDLFKDSSGMEWLRQEHIEEE